MKHFYRSALLILILTLTFFRVKGQDDRINTLLSEAEASVSRNNLPDAMSKIQEALEISGDNIPALLKRINIYYLMNNEKDALRCADDAIRSYPEQPDFYYIRGIIQNDREKYEKALNDFDRGLELKPSMNLYKFYLGRGVSHLNLLEYDQALSDFTTAIDMNDTVASAYHSRAIVNYEMHEYAAAVDDFLKALDHTNGNSALYFNLGMSYYRLDERSKACPYFHEACTLGNTSACRMALMECAKSIPPVP